MGTYNDLLAVVEQSGIWHDEKHRFFLSPDVFPLSSKNKSSLEQLGGALLDCLAGVGRIAVVAGSPELGRSFSWKMINKALWSGVPEIYRQMYKHRPSSIPDLLKVDMIELDDGSIKIAEIDAFNERGLGYGILFNKFRSIVSPEARVLPGTAKCLADVMKMRGYGDSIILLYANRERFYLSEFKIVAQEMRKIGIEVIVASEDEVRVAGKDILVRGRTVATRTFFYHPVMYYNLDLNNTLAQMYLAGEVDFLMPPKPFLGSKAVMALLRNDEGNKELEAVLLSQIAESSLKVVREYIPETFLVHRASCLKGQSPEGFVLKKTIASGMKGTFFQEDAAFASELMKANQADCSYVLQREVRSSARTFQYFDGCESLSSQVCYNRLIVHYIGRKLAEVTVTALPRKAVHGAVDSIFMGTVIVE